MRRLQRQDLPLPVPPLSPPPPPRNAYSRHGTLLPTAPPHLPGRPVYELPVPPPESSSTDPFQPPRHLSSRNPLEPLLSSPAYAEPACAPRWLIYPWARQASALRDASPWLDYGDSVLRRLRPRSRTWFRASGSLCTYTFIPIPLAKRVGLPPTWPRRTESARTRS